MDGATTKGQGNMHESMPSTRPHAGDLIGYWRNGRPIFLPGGGSTPSEPPQQVEPPQQTVRVVTPPPAAAPPVALTAEDLARERATWQADADARLAAREAELQQGFDARLGPIEAERAEQARVAQEAADQATEAERLRLEAEENAGQRAERIARESAEQLRIMQEQLAQRDALLAREQEYNAIQEYRREQIASHGETLYPALARLVAGNTRAEIDASIQQAEEASMEILADTASVQSGAAAAAEAARRGMQGVSPTLPAAGPMEMQPQTRELTAEQIANLNPAEYAALRPQLIGARASNPHQDRGIFS